MVWLAEARNATHQEKKLADLALTAFRSRLPFDSRKRSREGWLYRPATIVRDRLLQQRRKELGGYMPTREVPPPNFEAPPLEHFAESLAGSKGRAVSTTMGFVSMLRQLLKHPKIGKQIVPIIPDEGRTFGMESIIRQVGIYASQGQLYKPHDQDMLLYYREERMADPGRRHHRSRIDGIVHCGRHSIRQLQGADGPVFTYYSMLDFNASAT